MTQTQRLIGSKLSLIAAIAVFGAPAIGAPRDEILEYIGPPKPQIYFSFEKRFPGQAYPTRRPGNGQPAPGEKYFIIGQEPGRIWLETTDGYKSAPTGWTDGGGVEKSFRRRQTSTDPEMAAVRARLVEEENQAIAQQQTAQRAAEKERLDRDSAAKTKKDAERNSILQKQKEFLAKNGNAQGVAMANLNANPFVYEGKNIALHAKFDSMTAKDVGLFLAGNNAIVVSKIPTGTFTKQAPVLVVGEVVGKTDVRLPILGTVQVPHLRFVGVHFCSDAACSEVIPK